MPKLSAYASPPTAVKPRSMTVPTAVRREFERQFRKRFDRVCPEQWFLAYHLRRPGEPESAATDFRQFRHITPPRDVFWADPFPVRHNGAYYVFFEEYVRATHRGRIAVLELSADGTWSPPRVVLDRPYHLSYPCMFRWQDQWYMVPESRANRTIELWRCERFPDRWNLERTLLAGINASDATIAQIDGRFWMFGCVAAEEAVPCAELHIFHADSLFGPWRPHRGNPVVSDAAAARPAGSLFCSAGKWFRPAQDCSTTYGRRMTIREIELLTPTEYREREISTIEPNWARGLSATHTFNRVGDLTIIDGCRRRI